MGVTCLRHSVTWPAHRYVGFFVRVSIFCQDKHFLSCCGLKIVTKLSLPARPWTWHKLTVVRTCQANADLRRLHYNRHYSLCHYSSLNRWRSAKRQEQLRSCCDFLDKSWSAENTTTNTRAKLRKTTSFKHCLVLCWFCWRFPVPSGDVFLKSRKSISVSGEAMVRQDGAPQVIDGQKCIFWMI